MKAWKLGKVSLLAGNSGDDIIYPAYGRADAGTDHIHGGKDNDLINPIVKTLDADGV